MLIYSSIILVSIIHFIICILYILFNLVIQKKRFYKWSKSNISTHKDTNFFVLIPLFRESHLAEKCVVNFINEFKDIQNVKVVFITHYLDLVTSEIVKKTIKSYKKIDISLHLINSSKSFIKANQLNFALNYLEKEIKNEDFLSIYDCDSVPDARVFKFISNYLVSTNLSKEQMIVFQQSPYYPLNNPASLPLGRIATSKNIHSLNYHYTAEITSYFRTEISNPFRMSIHLTGHGEHIRLSALKYAGGFCPPSCDSSLGFALSYRNIPIVSVPIPDISSSPSKVSDMYRQGLRWYNGCDLYIRELKNLQPNFRVYIQALLSLFNNLRWFLITPTCLLSVILLLATNRVNNSSCYLVYILIIIALFRHLLLFFAYKQLHEFSKNNETDISPSFLSWITQYFFYYLVMRIIWSIPPWHYYILRLFGKNVLVTSTPKSEDNF